MLLARTDLIDAETLRPATNDVLDRLLRENISQDTAESVISEMLRRDLGDMEDRVLDAWPVVVFRRAIVRPQHAHGSSMAASYEAGLPAITRAARLRQLTG